MIINTNYERTPEMMMGRLFNISENIPILKMNRERGYWDGPEALDFHLGSNVIVVGPAMERLSLPVSGLASNGKTRAEYRRWLWGRICAKDSVILDELSKVTLQTSIAHWPEDQAIASIVQKAADWLWLQKPTPNVPSDRATQAWRRLLWAIRGIASRLGWLRRKTRGSVLPLPNLITV